MLFSVCLDVAVTRCQAVLLWPEAGVYDLTAPPDRDVLCGDDLPSAGHVAGWSGGPPRARTQGRTR